jgi:hypothetical protein
MFVDKGCKAPTFGRSELLRLVRASLSRDAQKSQSIINLIINNASVRQIMGPKMKSLSIRPETISL